MMTRSSLTPSPTTLSYVYFPVVADPRCGCSSLPCVVAACLKVLMKVNRKLYGYITTVEEFEWYDRLRQTRTHKQW
jgi:hypothetical protein